MSTTPPSGYVDLDDLRAEVDASYTEEQHQEYMDADADAETQIALAELVYKMRTEAGISQSELAQRMGIKQPFISDLERGGRTPTVATLARVARATGNRLHLTAEPIQSQSGNPTQRGSDTQPQDTSLTNS